MDFLKRHDQHRVRPVAVNETVPQAGVAIVSSFSVDMVREITINCWPRRWMGWGMASTCPYYLGPDHPSHCLHHALESSHTQSTAFRRPARYSPALCGTFRLRVPHFPGLPSPCIRFIPAPACKATLSSYRSYLESQEVQNLDHHEARIPARQIYLRTQTVLV